MQAIDTARQTLLTQLVPIEAEAAELEARLGEVAELKARLSQLNQDRNRLKAALKALDASKKPKAKASKPSPKQQDVRDVAIALVAENPGIAKADLEELIKHKLTAEMGFDLKGFEMRWKEVLGSGTLLVGDSGEVKLASVPHAEDDNDDAVGSKRSEVA